MYFRYHQHYDKPFKRVISQQKVDKGKKHFWGQLGGKYGFYTSEQQNDMKVSRIIHRRKYRSRLYTQTLQNNPQDQSFRGKVSLSNQRNSSSQSVLQYNIEISKPINQLKKRPMKISKNVDLKIELEQSDKNNNLFDKMQKRNAKIFKPSLKNCHLPGLKQYYDRLRMNNPTFQSSIDNPLNPLPFLSIDHQQ